MKTRKRYLLIISLLIVCFAFFLVGCDPEVSTSSESSTKKSSTQESSKTEDINRSVIPDVDDIESSSAIESKSNKESIDSKEQEDSTESIKKDIDTQESSSGSTEPEKKEEKIIPTDTPTPIPTPTPEPTVVEDKKTVETHYVANTNTKKFHYADCSSAEKIKEKNRQDFYGSRDALISQGYVPCKICNP